MSSKHINERADLSPPNKKNEIRRNEGMISLWEHLRANSEKLDVYILPEMIPFSNKFMYGGFRDIAQQVELKRMWTFRDDNDFQTDKWADFDLFPSQGSYSVSRRNCLTSCDMEFKTGKRLHIFQSHVHGNLCNNLFCFLIAILIGRWIKAPKIFGHAYLQLDFEINYVGVIQESDLSKSLKLNSRFIFTEVRALEFNALNLASHFPTGTDLLLKGFVKIRMNQLLKLDQDGARPIIDSWSIHVIYLTMTQNKDSKIFWLHKVFTRSSRTPTYNSNMSFFEAAIYRTITEELHFLSKHKNNCKTDVYQEFRLYFMVELMGIFIQ